MVIKPVSPRQPICDICLLSLEVHSINGIHFYHVDDAALEVAFHTVYSEIVCHNIAYADMIIT